MKLFDVSSNLHSNLLQTFLMCPFFFIFQWLGIVSGRGCLTLQYNSLILHNHSFNYSSNFNFNYTTSSSFTNKTLKPINKIVSQSPNTLIRIIESLSNQDLILFRLLVYFGFNFFN
eukprot:154852_1